MLIKHLKQGTQAKEPIGLIRAIRIIRVLKKSSLCLKEHEYSESTEYWLKSSSKELKQQSPQGSFALIWTIDNPLYLSDNPIQDAYVDKSALKKESTFVGQRKYLRLLLLLLVLLLLQIFLWQ